MKFKRSYSNARNLGSAYKFAFGGDINRAFIYYCDFFKRVILVKYLFQIFVKTVDESHSACVLIGCKPIRFFSLDINSKFK